ncbi:MAG: hypothetical protein HYX26_00975 [Acidobacteriales bacterium]|nr:hypothetical protein [Terriglobales bacterium]
MSAGAEEQRKMQGLGGGGESGQTNPPRAAFEVGCRTLKGCGFLRVREQVSDEWEDHAWDDFNSWRGEPAWKGETCEHLQRMYDLRYTICDFQSLAARPFAPTPYANQRPLALSHNSQIAHQKFFCPFASFAVK